MSQLELLDPTNEARPPHREPAPRLQTLVGKRIALLDISKPLGNFFLDVVEEGLKARGAQTQ
ncbi:MAG: hypothetical protein ACI91F_001706, partial [Candidatus Binatia bacterium]